jgi:hypothetical protein
MQTGFFTVDSIDDVTPGKQYGRLVGSYAAGVTDAPFGIVLVIEQIEAEGEQAARVYNETLVTGMKAGDVRVLQNQLASMLLIAGEKPLPDGAVTVDSLMAWLEKYKQTAIVKQLQRAIAAGDIR